MSKIHSSLTELIGNTPLVNISRYCEKNGAVANIIVKLECFNPLSSVKDRVGYALIADAEKKGIINKNTVIIEPTSGNTGVGLAYVAAIKGYSVILTMPETMSIERRKLLSALGAKIVLTEGKKGMNGAIEKANELHKEIENSYIPAQFDNPANSQAHRETTALEIYNDTDGMVDYFVAGVGTGGTLTGVGSVLKEKIDNVKIIAVEPKDSPVLSGGSASGHGLMGIGAGFIPKVLDTSVYDDIIQVTTEQAYNASRQLAKTEGMLVGISSGAALYAALTIAKKQENKDKNIVVLLPDTGERYLSTALFEE